MRHPQQSSLGGKIPSTIEPPPPPSTKNKNLKKKNLKINMKVQMNLRGQFDQIKVEQMQRVVLLLIVRGLDATQRAR
jgi:hypothetical protein